MAGELGILAVKTRLSDIVVWIRFIG